MSRRSPTTIPLLTTAALVVITTACTTPGRQLRSFDEPDERRGSVPTELHIQVENASFGDLDVYLHSRSGARHHLGTVMSTRTRRFVLDRRQYGDVQTFRLSARSTVGSRSWYTQELDVNPGQGVEWRVEQTTRTLAKVVG